MGGGEPSAGALVRRPRSPAGRARSRRLRALSAAHGRVPSPSTRHDVAREGPSQALVALGGVAIAGFVAACAAYQAGALSLRVASALVLAALGAYVWVVVQFARED